MKDQYICNNCGTEFDKSVIVRKGSLHTILSDGIGIKGVQVGKICGAIVRESDGLRIVNEAELKRLEFTNSKRLPDVVEKIDGKRYDWVGIGWVETDKRPDALLIQ